MANSQRDWRLIIRDELEILASEKEQVEYEKTVPHVDITQELLCGWFDDSYYPDDDEFQSWFTPSELEAMAAFNAFLDERVALLPESYGTVQNWLNCPTWREVMIEAQKLSTSSRPNPALNSDPAAGGPLLSPWQSLHPLFANQFGSGWAG